MTSKTEIQKLLGDFLKQFPEERQTVEPFVEFVGEFEGGKLYDRKNFTGHITVSALVADHSMEHFLMLDHVQLKKWLQPGGHVEVEDEGVLATAIREVEEETGIKPADYQIMCTANGVAVIDFDSHYIPECDYKHEAEHWHHDIRFVFRLRWDKNAIDLDLTESNGYKWITVSEFPTHFGISRMAERIKMFDHTLIQ